MSVHTSITAATRRAHMLSDSDESMVPLQEDGSRLSAVRLLDLFISFSLLCFLAPAFLVIAIAVKLQDGGSIFYGQKRIGFNGKEFTCYKFRSMRLNSAELLTKLLQSDAQARREWEADHKLKNDPRITSLGRFLRKTSLDEIPQLWNVLCGQMSLVGPRPIVRDEVYKYGRSFKAYMSVKPGITGLWQVMGRNDVTYRRRVALDRLYAKKLSVNIYFLIMFLTVPAVLFQKGSY